MNVKISHTAEVQKFLEEASGLLNDAGNPRTKALVYRCLLYTSPSPRDRQKSRMPSSA